MGRQFLTKFHDLQFFPLNYDIKVTYQMNQNQVWGGDTFKKHVTKGETILFPVK